MPANVLEGGSKIPRTYRSSCWRDLLLNMVDVKWIQRLVDLDANVAELGSVAAEAHADELLQL